MPAHFHSHYESEQSQDMAMTVEDMLDRGAAG